MPVVAQKIEIKASNKFKTYCRKAFGVSRFAYNWCVERFTKDYQQYLTEWSVYNRKLKEYSSSPLLHTQMPVKPKLPSASSQCLHQGRSGRKEKKRIKRLFSQIQKEELFIRLILYWRRSGKGKDFSVMLQET